MIIYEEDNQRWVIIKEGLYQHFNPDTRLPFKSEQDVLDYQARCDAKIAERKVTRDAENLAALKEIEAAKPPEPVPIDLAKLSDADFKKLILKKLGYSVKEV